MCNTLFQNIALPTGGVSDFPDNHFIVGLGDAVHGSHWAHGTQEGASRPQWSGAISERSPLLPVAQNNHFAEEKPNKIIRRFGQYGDTQYHMRHPTGIAVSPYTDDIFVTDSGLNTVIVFNATGSVIRSFACDCSVRDLAVTRGGTLLLAVSNAGNSLLREYTIHGELLASYGSFYGQENPFGIALTSRNQAVVTSLRQNCVHMLNTRFKPSVRFGSKGRGSTHFSMPYYVAINDDDELVIADSGNHRIKIHKLDGTFVREIGKQGSKVGELFYPMGLCTDRYKNVFVADANNFRVQVFSATGIFLGTPVKDTFEYGLDVKPVNVALLRDDVLLVMLRGSRFCEIQSYIIDSEKYAPKKSPNSTDCFCCALS